MINSRNENGHTSLLSIHSSKSLRSFLTTSAESVHCRSSQKRHNNEENMSSLCIAKNIISNPLEETSSTEQTATSSTWDRSGLDPSEIELDLSDFSILETTRVFFEKIDSLQECRLDADCTYEDATSRLLEDPKKYNSYGKIPVQEGLTTVEEVMHDAKAKKHAFEDLLESVVTSLGMDPNEEIVFDNNCCRDKEAINKSYKVLTRVPLKSKERCDAKTRERYGGDASFLCDAGRATIVCRTEDQIVQVIEELEVSSDVIRLKNRFSKPPITGIRDILMNIKVDGHIFELQIHLEEILAVARSFNAHRLYEYFRKYFVVDCDSFLYKEREEFIFRMCSPEDFDFQSSVSSVEVAFNPRNSFSASSDITEAIKGILKGEDIEALEALEEITKIFSVHELTLKALKKLLSLQMCAEEGDNEALLDRFHDMAEVYHEQGDYENALAWYERALEGYEAVLGKQHPSTLTAVNNMAIVYHKQRDCSKAAGARRSFC